MPCETSTHKQRPSPTAMSGSRLSTVYDYTSLRIHPDGSRVNQSSRNLRPRIARVAVRDARGNWIARDAGGSAAIRRYRTVRGGTPEGEQGEDFGSGDQVGDGGSEYEGSAGKGKGKENGEPRGMGEGKGKRKAKQTAGADADAGQRRTRDGRSAVKRQKFVHDVDWLEMHTPADGQPPLPSSVSP